MSGALIEARDYARQLGPIFPCSPDKTPMVKGGFHAATRDEIRICEWFVDNPGALIGMPTGAISGYVVLDVDVKNGVWGFDTLDELGFAVLPATPMVHTRSGGLHIYFRAPEHELRNTSGKHGRGIGPGLDWRGDGGYVILPSPSSGYSWDPRCNFDTLAVASVPKELLPRDTVRQYTTALAPLPVTGLSPYAEKALDGACRRIIAAPAGEQEATINAKAFRIGTLAGANAISAAFARRALTWAAHQVPTYDPRRPWRGAELERKIDKAFADGVCRSRDAHRG
jgi:hypothetical protein